MFVKEKYPANSVLANKVPAKNMSVKTNNNKLLTVKIAIMKVTLRERIKNGKISLYLDYYNKGKRKTEYLSLYLNLNPKTKTEREVMTKVLFLISLFQKFEAEYARTYRPT